MRLIEQAPYTSLFPVLGILLAVATAACALMPASGSPSGQDHTDAQTAGDWKTDPAWHQGKAEWALYEAKRVIYNKTREYEATIFTNIQHMDPETTTKAEDWQDPDALPVFKHNISEIIPTDNYKYRFLTTSFVHTATVKPYKIVASSQEDCGSSFKLFVADEETTKISQHGYFPGEESSETTIEHQGPLDFHDALTLTLRDYPFGAQFIRPPTMNLLGDQTTNKLVDIQPHEATISEIGDETITVPFGTVRTHHLRVHHKEMGGTDHSDYWFAAEPGMRNVLVKYEGPYETVYELKRLDWWAYWSDPKPAE